MKRQAVRQTNRNKLYRRGTGECSELAVFLNAMAAALFCRFQSSRSVWIVCEKCGEIHVTKESPDDIGQAMTTTECAWKDTGKRQQDVKTPMRL